MNQSISEFRSYDNKVQGKCVDKFKQKNTTKCN